MRKFESHLTAHIRDAKAVQELVERGPFPNLKFSKIDGDAQMGAKPWCYITAYHTNQHLLYATMQDISRELKEMGVETLRLKIEEIIYDTKTNHNVL